MKKLIVAGFLLIVVLSCNKDKTQPVFNYLDYIVAGTTEGTGVKYSGTIDETLLFLYPSSGANRLIDINEDGINDFELMFYGSASPGHSNSNNSIATIGSSFLATPNFTNLVDTLSFNDTIDSGLNWVNDTCVIHNHYYDLSGASSQNGLWNNVTNKYIGTKILVNGEELYGWIRVEIMNGWNLTLIDYACTVGY